jgi:hypothetical protein
MFPVKPLLFCHPGRVRLRARSQLARFVLILAVGICAISAASPAAAQQPWEGYWARSARECLPSDLPSSKTFINLSQRDHGRRRSLLDQYENHCEIVSVSRTSVGVRLRLVCYEFWKDFNSRRNGRASIAHLTISGSDRLTLSGKNYVRCHPPQANRD